MRIENDRNIQSGFEGYYVTMTTGFAKLKRDASIVIDKSTAFSGAGFPSWMSYANAQRQIIS